MKNIITLLAMLTAFGLGAHEDDHLGSAHFTGAGKIYHDGDYVTYNVEFSASCYADLDTAINNINDGVEELVDYLDDQESAYENNSLGYHVDLISSWQQGRGYAYDDPRRDPCEYRYFARQTISITLNRSEEYDALDSDVVQSFYDHIHEYIWPHNYQEGEGSHTYSSAKVISVRKGIFDETATLMRMHAISLARENAIRDFLTVMGHDYSGLWHLHEVDFVREDFRRYHETSLAGGVMPVPAVPGDLPAAPKASQIKLEPLSFSITGNFLFHFDVYDHRELVRQ